MSQQKELDPIQQMEQMAQRAGYEEKASKAITKGRIKLIMNKNANAVFFATLALRLKPRIEWGIDTLAVDGKSLFYNPEFTCKLSDDELIGVLLHEVMHCALDHFARKGARNHARFNISADLAVNPIVLDAGYTLPDCRLMPGEMHKDRPKLTGYGAKLADAIATMKKGESAEAYYSQIPEPDPGDGGGEGDPGGCGSVIAAGDGSEAAQKVAEADWKSAVAQAVSAAKEAVAKGNRGTLSGDIERLCAELLEPKVDWKHVLRQYLTRWSFDEYSWSRGNRRFVSQGLYLPSVRNETLGTLVISIDTSGSIGVKEVTRFLSEVMGILECGPTECTVLFHHSAVYQKITWTPCDGALQVEKLKSGGTAHRPVFDAIEALDEPPACAIFLTDLESDLDSCEEPEYPCLFAVIGNKGAVAPFGETLEVDMD